MKRLIAAIILLGVSVAARAQDPDSVAFVNADWKITELERGAEAMYASIPMFNSIQSICVIKYPARKFRTEILAREGKKADIPSRIGKEVGAAFVLNAGYFDMKNLTSAVYFRVGDEVYGQTQPNEASRVDGVIAFKDKKGRKVLIAKSDTTQYDEVAGKCHTVLATGPTLIIKDEIIASPLIQNSFYSGRHPRTAFGTDINGNIYMVVIDGRFPGQADGATIWETARICKLLGMTDASNLDGGGSSAIWNSKDGVISHPSDNKKFNHKGERKIPNMIVTY
jgi:exopolysaccharide biosynthesis protein